MSQRERSLVLALGLALSIVFLHHAHAQYRTGVSGDYYQFWVVAQAISTAGVTNPYTSEARKEIAEEFWQRSRGSDQSEYAKAARYRRDRLEPAGTPFLYTAFRAISTGHYETDYEIYRWLSLLAYVFGVVAITRVLGLSLPLAALLILATTEWFWPFRIEIAHANVNQLQVGGIGAIVLARARLPERPGAVLAGLLLGLGLCFKPNLLYSAVLLFGFWLVRGQARTLLFAGAGLAAGVAVAAISAALFFGGPACWSDWWRGSAEILQSPDYLRRSLPRLLGFSPPLWSMWAAGAALCAPLLWRASRARESHESEPAQELLMLAAGAVVLVLSAPVVHVHYFVLCVPMLVVALAAPKPRWSLGGLGPRHGVAIAALLLMGGIFGAHFTLWPFLAAAMLYGVALVEAVPTQASVR
jgi:hypothetical protein